MNNIDFTKLEQCRGMMALSSPEMGAVGGGNGDNKLIAEFAWSEAVKTAPEGIKKRFHSCVVDCYMKDISEDNLDYFKQQCKLKTWRILKAKGMRKKMAIKIRDVALHCLITRDLKEWERADMMGVNTNNYCMRYRDCVDSLIADFSDCLFHADDIVREQLAD